MPYTHRAQLTDEQWIQQCEEEFSKKLQEIVTELCSTDQTHLIRLAGPTCSGKTTVSNMLKRHFEMAGRRLHIISIDDFYFDREKLYEVSLKKGTSQIDYDSAETIDWEAFRSFTQEIMTSDRSSCPVFDFKEGKRVGYKKYESGPEDVFLFEGIQVLYPEANEVFNFCDERVVGIYIAPQSSLQAGDQTVEPNELRLLRRLVRDANFRGTSPEKTMVLWKGVRANEEAHIFPYVGECDYRIDSTMAYELGILKPYLNRLLSEIPRENVHWEACHRILSLLSQVPEISDQLIQPGSLYKEFV